MRISLIGPGDIKFHYQELLGIPQPEFELELEKIAQALVDADVELEILPSEGVEIEVAKLYKQKGGKKVMGGIPKADKTFGIKHLQKSIDTQVNGKPLFDEFIDTGDWFKNDLIRGLLGEKLLYLGSSPGTGAARDHAVYLFKLIQRFKKGVEVDATAIHPEIRARDEFEIIVYSPFMKSGALLEEDEIYMKKFGIKLTYVSSAEELKSALI